MPRRSCHLAVGVLAVGGLTLSACGGSGGPADDREGGVEGQPLVVATTSILGDVVANVVGDAAEVRVLMPAGVDPHAYQASAADAAVLRDADLIVAVGLSLEANLLDVLDAAEEQGVPVLSLAPQLDPLAFRPPDADAHEDAHAHDDGDVHDDEDVHDDGHDHGPLDPHVWLDPVRMAEGADLIAAELDGVAEGGWAARASDYAAELLAVHEELEDGFAVLPDDARRLVTNHDALGYLAARYDFEVVGTVTPGTSTLADADAQAFAGLVATVIEHDVPAIFTENVDTTVLADQLANEVVARGGDPVAVVSLHTDALGAPGSGAETYLDLLRENGRRIVEALR